MRSIKIVANIIKISKLNASKSNIPVCYSTQNVASGKLESIENLFINPDVQRILKKITARDFEKIFAISKKPLEPHRYEFVTDKMLKELQEKAASQASQKLQMPPVISVRNPINEVLSKDPELQGYLQHKIIFTDISPDVSSRDRLITVRETDGTLRKATWEERDRMNQIFYPMPGKSLETPKMFESPYLDRLLEEGSYKFILDCACVQFEPDDAEYHRVTKSTYEHIKNLKKFDDLRSTRHFGPMAFYYAYSKMIDPLLVDMIQRQLLSDASDTIKLFYLINKELTFSKNIDENNHIAIIEDYIETHALQKEDIKFAIQTFLEQNSTTSNQISA